MQIELNDDLLIGRGTRRACYQHPDEASLCIKISTGTPNSVKQQARGVLLLSRARKNVESILAISHGMKERSKPTSELDISTSASKTTMVPTQRVSITTLKETKTRSLYSNSLNSKTTYSNTVSSFMISMGGNIICQKDAQGELRLVMIDGIGEVISFYLP